MTATGLGLGLAFLSFRGEDVYNASTAFMDAVASGGRRIKTKAIFNNTTTLYGDGTNGAVVSIKHNEVMDSKDLSCGGTAASSVSIQIRMPSSPLSLNNGTVQPYIGLRVGSSDEYVPLGVFYITEVKSNTSMTVFDVVAYDGMLKLEKTYEPNVTFPAPASAVMNDICTQAGITFSGTLDSISLQGLYEGTMRDIVGYIAGLHGKNARFNRSGVLEFAYYANAFDGDVPADLQYMNGVETQTDDALVVSSVTSGTEDDPIVVGNGAGISFNNPYMTLERLQALSTSLIGLNYRPMKVHWRGNPCVQCGDTLNVTISSGSAPCFVMARTLTVNGGMSEEVECYGATDRQIALEKTPSQRRISQVYSDFKKAISDATALINGAKGGIIRVTDSDGDGVNDGLTINQSADPTYIGKCIVENYAGIGFSSDGGRTYNVAITTDGEIDGRYIRAGTITADQITVNGTTLGSLIYMGHRRPNDTSTELVIRIGAASVGTIQEILGNRTSIFKAEDIDTYISDTTKTDAWLDGQALMYYTDTDFVLQRLGQFKIGNLMIQPQQNGGVSFVKSS